MGTSDQAVATDLRCEPAPGALAQAILRGVDFLSTIQGADGSFRGDYGGPMFLLPMYVATHYIAGREIPPTQRERMVTYFRSVQNSDGSIGLHAEGEGSMFTSALSYVALRMLGVSAADGALVRLRTWIARHGSPLGSASWGKFILALLNLYGYEGLHPVPPELWLLPYAAPIHPGRLWCHCRQVYLPMSYLYGRKFTVAADPLIESLRAELYETPYADIDFAKHRDTLCESDNLVERSSVLKAVNWLTGTYERVHAPWLRERALAKVLDHIVYEDNATHGIRIGPVNAVLNTLVHVAADPNSENAEQSFATLAEYLWDGHDGMKMNGYNSCALWDTAFVVQAVMASDMRDERSRALLTRAHDYIRDNQVVDELPDRDRYFRHACRGGWPFSDRAHGWPITDCTAEGLKSALLMEHDVAAPVPEHLLVDAVELILSFQNPQSGGWSTYELQRGGRWLELLNPSEVFSAIMVDYPYVECTSACIQALAAARQRFPGRFDASIARAIRKGTGFLRTEQRPDGSFEGSWAVCFTYGTWFGVCGLRAAGVAQSDPAIRRAVAFLEAHQNPDGGWGEHYLSCLERRYIPLEPSHVVNTAWAVLALCAAGEHESAATRRGVELLLRTQQTDGDWPRQSIVGVFNKSALINYENYRRYFPIWALSRFRAASS